MITTLIEATRRSKTMKKNHIYIFLALFLFISCLQNAGLDYYNVLMYKNNEQRTGFYDTTGVPVLHGIKWKYEGNSAKCFIYNGILLAGDETFDSTTGKKLTEDQFSKRIIFKNIAIGNQIKPSVNSFLSAWSLENQKKIWENQTIYSVRDLLIHKDILYVVSEIPDKEGYLYFIYVVNPMTGEILEKIEPNMDVHGIAFWKDTMVFVSSTGIYTIDFSSGTKGKIEKIFSRETAGISTLPVINNDNVYFVDSAGVLFSVNLKTKKVNWRLQCNGKAFGSASNSVSIYDGIIYVSNIDTFLFIDEKTGEILVTVDQKNHWVATPAAITKDGVYFSSGDGMLFALDRKTGKELWNLKLAKQCIASPIVSNGVIYIPAFDTLDKGYIFAIY